LRTTRSTEIARRRRRGLWGQIWTLLLRPIEFFRTLPAYADARHWVFAALITIVLVSLSAVQRNTLLNPPAETSTTLFNWNIALITASTFLVSWVVQAVLLSVASLLSGSAPRFGLNLQIAIWAALPLGLMAGLQLLYYNAGGVIGAEGVSGLVSEIPSYADLSPFALAAVTALAAQVTIFWLWNLLLLYFGARYALDGGWLAAAFIVVAWVLVLVLVPVVIQMART
jgi:hypothetical protein